MSESPVVQSVENVEDVVYHRPGTGPLLARLYRPPNERQASGGRLPAVVSVHGGRWCAETRLTNAVIDRRLAEAGVFVMALDFRMPPLAKFPAPVADINLAIRWLKQRAPSLGLDANAIGGIGTSSGGHQLLLDALRPGDARFAAESLPDGPGADAALAFVIACWPVADPLARYRYALEKNMSIHIDSHHAYWQDEAQMAEGSPQRIVEAGDMTHLPPLLLIQGTDDTVLSPGMTQRFAAAYRAAGGAVTLREFAGQAHTFITKFPEHAASQAALDAIAAFAVGGGQLDEPRAA